MATISVNGRTYPNIQLIAFDKDGTLVDFNHLWAERTNRWLTWLLRKEENGRQDLFLTLCTSLGFDPQRNIVISDSPLAVASLPKLYTIAATVLYQNGRSWVEAEQIVQESLNAGINALPDSREIKPVGDVQGTLRKLVSAGVRLAVITSDDRIITKAILSIMGVENLVDQLVCGDDEVPNKPAPDGLWAAGERLKIQTSRMLMVGDTVSDMKFGRNAGVAGCIGIRGGAGDTFDLSQAADEVVNSIDEFEISPDPVFQSEGQGS